MPSAWCTVNSKRAKRCTIPILADKYPEEELVDYNQTARAQDIWVIRNQLYPEEQDRFDRQPETQNVQLVEIAQRHLTLQKLPIGNPNLIPKRQFIQKKTHGRADARGLTGPELADRALVVKEQGEQQQH